MDARRDLTVDGSIDRLLSDPLTRLLMRADGVDERVARKLLTDAARALALRRRKQAMSTNGHSGPGDGLAFRPGVGILLFNGDGLVFVGQRCDVAEPAWQAPQGGIDDGESSREAALRELREETGVRRVEILAETLGWLRYGFPAEVIAHARHRGWRGQQQKWFAMRLLGSEEEIDLSGEDAEFSDWRWVALRELPSLIVPFKRGVYAALARSFAPFAQ